MAGTMVADGLTRGERRRAARIGRIIGGCMDGSTIRGWGERHPWFVGRCDRIRVLWDEALRPANSVSEQLALDAIVWREIRAAAKSSPEAS